MLRSLPLLLFVALLGCEIDVEAVVVTDEFEVAYAPVDVVFVVDDSNSMEASQALVAAAIPSLTGAFAESGVAWRAAVTTTDIDDVARRGRFAPIGPGGQVWTEDAGQLAAGIGVGIVGSNLERGLEAAWYALTPPLATHDNDGFRREEARLAIVIVSDEDDCSDEGALLGAEPAACTSAIASLVPVEDYVARFGDLVAEPGDVGLWALVETGVSAEHAGCGGPTPGTRYIDAARGTAGEVAPLCGDLGPVLAEFGRQMRGERAAFRLGRTPDRSTLDVVKVAADGTETPLVDDPANLDGYSYVAAANTIRLWGPARPGPGETITATYSVGISP